MRVLRAQRHTGCASRVIPHLVGRRLPGMHPPRAAPWGVVHHPKERVLVILGSDIFCSEALQNQGNFICFLITKRDDIQSLECTNTSNRQISSNLKRYAVLIWYSKTFRCTSFQFVLRRNEKVGVSFSNSRLRCSYVHTCV